MAGKNWRDYPAGSRERYEAAKKDPSVAVGPFMGGDYRIREARTAKKKSQGGGAPWYGDSGPSRSRRMPKGDQRDMGPNPPKNPKSEALARMRKRKAK